eukprot:7276653-Pyramimonas_sp.AAC.1
MNARTVLSNDENLKQKANDATTTLAAVPLRVARGQLQGQFYKRSQPPPGEECGLQSLRRLTFLLEFLRLPGLVKEIEPTPT